MKALSDRGNPEDFFARLKQSSSRALLLDYDGTLAPFVVERDQAVPYPQVGELLDAIVAEGSTRLVIVSGRWTKDLIPLLGMQEPTEIWGCHGWERLWPDGRREEGRLPRIVEQALDHAAAWARGRGFASHVEVKPASVALHWRGLSTDARNQIRNSGEAAWTPLARKVGLELHEFDGGLELRFPGRDKGYAVRQILGELPKGAAVAYLGDDRTDEDAFCALRGRGLNVLVRDEYRPTAADLWLRPPEELLQFLSSWLKFCRQGG